MTMALEGGEWSAAHPGHTLPPGKTRCPFYRRGLDGQKISSPLGFDPRLSSPQTVATPTELLGPPNALYHLLFYGPTTKAWLKRSVAFMVRPASLYSEDFMICQHQAMNEKCFSCICCQHQGKCSMADRSQGLPITIQFSIFCLLIF